MQWKPWQSAALLLLTLASSAQSQTAEDRAKPSASSGEAVRVAAISFVPRKFDLAGNANEMEKAFREAKKGGAKIAVAPEGALDGYNINEIIAGKANAEKMNGVAVPIDDPVIGRFRSLARELEICLAFGFAERIERDIYNCMVFIDREGNIRGKQHKMQFAEGYDPSWWFNRLGCHGRTFDTPYGRCGMLICNDRWNPEIARILALDGAQFLLICANGSTAEKQDQTVLSRGKENSVPVVEANVGVTLIVDGGRIIAVDRRRNGITFGQITIPPAPKRNIAERDRIEGEFLRWREREMPRRYEKQQQHLRDKSKPPS